MAMGLGAYAHIRRQFRLISMEGSSRWRAYRRRLRMMDAAASLITYGIMLVKETAVLSAIVKYTAPPHSSRSLMQWISQVVRHYARRRQLLARGYQAPIASRRRGNILTRSA